jgi:hypothetical protein
MLNSNAFFDFDFVKPILKRDYDEQQFIEYAINVVSSECESYVGRKLIAQDLTDILSNYSGNPSNNAIICPEYPVTNVEHLYIDELHAFGGDTEIESTDFILNNDAGVIYLTKMTVPVVGPQGIKIEYNAGYMPKWTKTPTFTFADPTKIEEIPFTLVEAAMEALIWETTRLMGRTIGERFTNRDGLNITFEITLPQHTRDILDSYKRRFT